MLRSRKFQGNDQESSVEDLVNRNSELETLVSSFKQMLETSRSREKRLAMALEELGGNLSLDLESGEVLEGEYNSTKAKMTLLSSLVDRGGWLIGLLLFQSCSSFILIANNNVLSAHPTIVYFLTMLVGAGGNAGNQAAVRVIRGLALGNLNAKTKYTFIKRELFMACILSLCLGATGLIRALLAPNTSTGEAVAITFALMLIVFISIVLGALLPLLMDYMKCDPAHASTTIQVVMDILGVLICCSVAVLVLETAQGQHLLAMFGIH